MTQIVFKRLLLKSRRILFRKTVGEVLIGIFIGIAGTVFGTWIYNEINSLGPTEETARIKEVIQLEATLATQQPRTEEIVTRYGKLFDEKAWVVDEQKAQLWIGKDEVLQRFKSLEEFTKLEHMYDNEPQIIDDDSAIVITTTKLEFIQRSTASIESYMAKETWILQKIKGRWKIICLQLNPTGK